MNIQFCCPVICTAVVVWFFETILPIVRRSLSINVDFRPLFLFADVVFPWFMYADITLETVALDTCNNVSGFVRDAPAKHAPTICPLSKSDNSPISRFFHMNYHLKQSLMHLHEHYRVQTNGKTFSVANWIYFNVANTNSTPQFFSVSIILSTPVFYINLDCTSTSLAEFVLFMGMSPYNVLTCTLVQVITPSLAISTPVL
jgi:hypothetical protein